ncbi:MAG: flagellar biosynthesis protein FlhF [Candidatus Cloacimonadota bacterium]|nr:MAG: flagellar biosynthesis protein FlhF [Candidatus Cloacimonadota bacterium]
MHTKNRRIFTASTYDKTMSEVKKAFGPQPIILSISTIREGALFGIIGGTKRCEIIAEVPKNKAIKKVYAKSKAQNTLTPEEHKKALQNLFGQKLSTLKRSQLKPKKPLLVDFEESESDELLKILYAKKDGLKSKSKYAVSKDASITKEISTQIKKVENKELSELKHQMSEMRKAILDLKSDFRASTKVPIIKKIKETKDLIQPEVVLDKSLEAFHENLKVIEENLLENDFSREIVKTYVSLLKSSEDLKDLSLADLKENLRLKFKNTIKIGESIFEKVKNKKQDKPRVMAFVGPTGVGKTTTVAKIACGLAQLDNKVAMITLDTFKVGATDQLKFYGKGMKVDVEVAYRPDKLQALIEKHQDKDVILIDTVGRGPKSDLQITAIKDFLPDSLNAEVHLLLSANFKFRDMIETFRSFNRLGVDGFLFTKLDETSSFGSMLSVLQKCTKTISYVTTGQAVPGFYKVINKEYLSQLMFSNSI